MPSDMHDIQVVLDLCVSLDDGLIADCLSFVLIWMQKMCGVERKCRSPDPK